MSDSIALIGSYFEDMGSVSRPCKVCGTPVYVQVENVPLVANTGGTYLCMFCLMAKTVADHNMVCKGFAHHGKLIDPTPNQIASLIHDIHRNLRR